MCIRDSNIMIKRLFDKARAKAWGKMLQLQSVQELIAEKERIDRANRTSLKQTSALTLVNK